MTGCVTRAPLLWVAQRPVAFRRAVGSGRSGETCLGWRVGAPCCGCTWAGKLGGLVGNAMRW